MHNCSNCNTPFDTTKEGVVVSAKGQVATAICDGCMVNARLIKLVVRRGDIGSFAYEQFSVIETVGGMTTAKRAG
jgi:hypothetical protein